MRTLQDAVLALDAGQTTSRRLVEDCLDRIADPAGEGARTFIRTYPEQARRSADAMDALRAAGRAPSAYAGIPVSLKDLLDVQGEPTPAGSVVLAAAPPAKASATVVRRLLAAGMIPVGRTNMTEFAFSGVGINPHYGTPQSPYGRVQGDPLAGRVPGGSSSGAAVSVADFQAFAAIGTDTGGSCRVPAAFCGVVGYKPTASRVPRDGVLPLSRTLDSVGPLARSVACCAATDALLAGEAFVHGPVPPCAGLRLVIPENFVLDGMDAATERAVDAAVQRLDRAGVSIDRIRLAGLDQYVQAHARGGLAVVESYAWHRTLLAREGARYDQRVANRMRPGAAMSAVEYLDLLEARARIIGVFAAEMAPYDALLMPTVPIAPPLISAFDQDDDYRRLNALILRNSAWVNFMDGCAISLPCHEPGSPPAGLTLARTAMGDQRLFSLAAALEPVITPRR